MFPILFLPLAIYLCKRTMQNKARLELADYEAVGTLLLEFKAGGGCGESFACQLNAAILCLGVSLYCAFFAVVKIVLRLIWRRHRERDWGTSLAALQYIKLKHLLYIQPSEIGKITQKFTLVSSLQLTVPGLYSRY